MKGGFTCGGAMDLVLDFPLIRSLTDHLGTDIFTAVITRIFVDSGNRGR